MFGSRTSPVRYLLIPVLALLAAAPAAAQAPKPGTFLVFSRFQIDQGYDSTVRVTNLNELEAVDVQVKFVCAGDDGQCDSLATTVSLDPGQTRAVDPGGINLGCGQGFAVAYAVDEVGEPKAFDYLAGTYEVSVGGKGKRREADVAVAIESELIVSIDDPVLLVPGAFAAIGQRLLTDFRSISVPDRKGVRRQGSYLNLLDLSVEAGASNSDSRATVEWWTEDGDTSFSTTYSFTCFGRIRLDDINVNLLEENHGSAVGWMRVRARGDSILVGSISEFGKGSATLRNMFDGSEQNGPARRGRGR